MPALHRALYTHTRAHTHTHARTHARVSAHARTHKHARTHARAHTHTNRSDTELKWFPVTRVTAFGRQIWPPNLGREHSPLEIESDRPPCAALLAAPPKAGGEGFAPRGQPLQRCTVHVAGALDLNDAAPSSPIQLPARTAAPRLAPNKIPPTATALRATAPAHSTQHHQRIAGVCKHPAHSAAACRCTQRTVEVQRRQLRHPSETRSQRRCPAISDVIDCTHHRRSARPSHNPHPSATAPRAPPAHSPQLQLCAASVRGQSLTAQLPADARSVPPRFSHVSCAILPRLGASDAAPASPIQLSARIAAPRLAPRKTPTTRYSPARYNLGPQHAISSAHCRRSQAPAHSAAARRCTQRTTEVQRRQLRHPSETRCQRRCPIIFDLIACTIQRPSARPAQTPTSRYRSQRSCPPMNAAYS
jgi:hypothetical protein